MAAQDILEDDLLELLLTNIDAPNIGDPGGLRGSVVAGNWYISLHTAEPPESSSDQTQDEATYTGYARAGVARTPAEWTVAGGTGDNDNPITYPQATGGSETITHFGFGSDAAGVGNLQIVGALTASLAVSAGITPEFAAGELDLSID